MDVDERCDSIKEAFNAAKKKEDFDLILKTYNIKMRKAGKIASAARVKLPVKKAIIRMAFYEPDDMFDYDRYMVVNH